MQYAILGRTGLRVSRLGFGAMRLPMKEGHVNRERAFRVIQEAFSLGVNFIDSAVGYCSGESEEVVGECLRGRRDRTVVSTKNPYHKESGKEWRALLDQSLRRLRVDTIDCYHLHFLPWAAYSGPMSVRGGPREEARRALKEGVIRHLGFSSHDTPDNIRKLIETDEFDTMIVQYNLLDRKNEGVIELAARKGMGVIIMGPVGGGRLAFPSPTLTRIVPGARTTAEVALRFVLSNPHISLAMSGMNTLKMVRENARVASLAEPLRPALRERVLKHLDRLHRRRDLICTGCGYCMPCPHGVDIPANFALLAYADVFGLEELAVKRYHTLGRRTDREGRRTPAWAAACRQCGVCEPKCPQKIPIRRRLKRVHATLAAHR